MARNRKHETVEESAPTVSEMGANILTLSTRAAEQSAQGFSRMLGLGQNSGDVIQQSSRTMGLLQNWALISGAGYREISLEYVNWLQKQMQVNLTSVSRIMQSRTPDQLVAAYNQFVGENIALILTLNGRIAGISKAAVDRTAERITELAEEAELARDQAA